MPNPSNKDKFFIIYFLINDNIFYTILYINSFMKNNYFNNNLVMNQYK